MSFEHIAMLSVSTDLYHSVKSKLYVNTKALVHQNNYSKHLFQLVSYDITSVLQQNITLFSLLGSFQKMSIISLPNLLSSNN